MCIDQSLRFFVTHLQPRAIALRGRWGVGKTFYWREQVVKQFFADANLRREDRGYAYVSLFGIESVQQIKNALAYSYAENEQPGVLWVARQWIKRWLRRVGKFFNRALADEVSLGGKRFGAKVKVNSLINDFAFLSIKRALVCIDDVERRNAKLAIGDVLGLISYLVEERQCRVILILNFDALSDPDKDEWERSKDKVFENELLYQPALEKSIEVGMRGTEYESWHQVVKESLARLKIDNVRVVARAQRFVRQLLNEMPAHNSLRAVADDAWIQIARIATILSAAYASRAMGAPDVLAIVDPHRLSLSKEDNAEEEGLTEDQKEWKARIEEYGLYFGDSLDKAIARSVLDGYPRMDLLVPAALEWDQIREKHAIEQKYQRAWDLYHSSLKDDNDEVFRVFQDALPGVIATESVHNIEATGRLFRVMRHPDAATELYRSWIEARAGDRREELLEESFFPGTTVTDEEFKKLIEQAREGGLDVYMPLADALRELDTNSWSEAAITSIASADPSAIADVLVSEYRNWRRCVRTLTTYTLHGEMGAAARTRFLLALKIVSEKSPLNADRIRNKLRGLNLEAELEKLERQKNFDETD